MIKKLIIMLVLLTFTLNSCGCAGTWRRKFVRKKKGEDIEGPVLQPYDYKKEFNNQQLYVNHFTFWKNAESEIIYCLSMTEINNKKLNANVSYALIEIKKMHELLKPEKQQELKPYVDELADFANRVKLSGYVNSHQNLLVSTIKKHYRQVNRYFAYRNIKPFIKEDEPVEPGEE